RRSYNASGWRRHEKQLTTITAWASGVDDTRTDARIARQTHGDGLALACLRPRRYFAVVARQGSRDAGRIDRAAARQLSVLPSELRRADVETAAPHSRARLFSGDADQPQQPRAGRRPGHGQNGDGGRGRAGADVRLRNPSGP